MPGKYDLVCFDMDGTLTAVKSTWSWVHDCLGTDNSEGYEAFVNQRISEEEFRNTDIGMWKKARPDIGRKDLIGFFQRIPLVEGIQETVTALNDRGMTCVIVSGGVDLAAEMIANEFGFSDWVCDKIEIAEDGSLAGSRKVVDLFDKGSWVREFCRKYDTVPERTVSIGNSFSDTSMFKITGLSIAFNPVDEYTASAAQHVIRSGNISDVLDIVFGKSQTD